MNSLLARVGRCGQWPTTKKQNMRIRALSSRLPLIPRRLLSSGPTTSATSTEVAAGTHGQRDAETNAAWERMLNAINNLKVYYPTVEERQNAVKEYGQAVRGLRRKGLRAPMPKGNRPIIMQQQARNEMLEKKAQEANLPWRTVISVVIMRYPFITRDPEPWEADMLRVQEYLEELRREHYGNKIRGTSSEITSLKYPSVEEIYETLPFKPSPRVVEADISNDVRSMNRKYQEPLFLVLKRNREDNAWQFPQGKWLPEEGAHDTYSRVLKRAVTEPFELFANNDIPIGHYLYEYPKELQEKRGQFGAKVFFYSGRVLQRYLEKTSINNTLYTDHAWIGRNDLKGYFDPDTAEYLEYLLPL